MKDTQKRTDSLLLKECKLANCEHEIDGKCRKGFMRECIILPKGESKKIDQRHVC